MCFIHELDMKQNHMGWNIGPNHLVVLDIKPGHIYDLVSNTKQNQMSWPNLFKLRAKGTDSVLLMTRFLTKLSMK